MQTPSPMRWWLIINAVQGIMMLYGKVGYKNKMMVTTDSVVWNMLSERKLWIRKREGVIKGINLMQNVSRALRQGEAEKWAKIDTQILIAPSAKATFRVWIWNILSSLLCPYCYVMLHEAKIAMLKWQDRFVGAAICISTNYISSKTYLAKPFSRL